MVHQVQMSLHLLEVCPSEIIDLNPQEGVASSSSAPQEIEALNSEESFFEINVGSETLPTSIKEDGLPWAWAPYDCHSHPRAPPTAEQCQNILCLCQIGV